MERLEQILKWSWLAMPILVPGWVLIAVSILGGASWALVMTYFTEEWNKNHGPFTQTTVVVVFGLAPLAFCIWSLVSSDLPHWLPYDYFHEWTILHWIGIL